MCCTSVLAELVLKAISATFLALSIRALLCRRVAALPLAVIARCRWPSSPAAVQRQSGQSVACGDPTDRAQGLL